MIDKRVRRRTRRDDGTGGKVGEAAALAGWAALAAPLSVLLHEGGHWAVARAFGYPARIMAAHIEGGATFENAPAWLMGLQSAAGPLVTVLISLAAARLYAQDRSRRWALALAATTPWRFLVTTAFLGAYLFVTLLGRRFGGNPNFDEHHVARALGLPPVAVAAAASLALLLFWFWLIRRIPRGRRLTSIAALIAGTAAGMFAWVTFAPRLLAAVQG